MVHILALGVYSSGFVKDMLCLPRPLSPPLHRITLSKSAALEYGFPSTHSTNAVSVACYALLLLYGEHSLSSSVSTSLQIIFTFYALSIVLGRLYCGMHGFFDVLVGSLLGFIIGLLQYLYGDAFDRHIRSASTIDAVVVLLAVLVLIRIHPEPADNCPCFDDSVAFSGVVLGIEHGSWESIGPQNPAKFVPETTRSNFAELPLSVTLGRILLGVCIIFSWRAIMKTILLRLLPPVFRVIEKLGLTLPRTFFKQASEYSRIPKLRKDDHVIPAISEFPSFLSSIRHPRKRSISIGPQSEADAYETLANRAIRRRNTTSNEGKPADPILSRDLFQRSTKAVNGSLGRPNLQHLEGDSRPNAVKPNGAVSSPTDKDPFVGLETPRVRYDVEVVTKLIVYFGRLSPPSQCRYQTKRLAGIGWLAAKGNLDLFDRLGLGVGSSFDLESPVR